MDKLILGIICLSVLSACGRGGTSSSGSAGDPVASRACIDTRTDRNNGDSFTTFINECNFDINVAELDGGSDEESFIVEANSRRTIDRSFVAWGACRAPYIVDEDRPFNYRCRMR